MEVTENPLALEVAVAENPVLKGGAGGCPAPEGVAGDDPALMGSASCNPTPECVRASSPSHTSMDVHVGSSPPHSGGIIVVHALDDGVTLEVGVLDAGVLMPASGVELIPGDVLQTAPVDIPSSSHNLASCDLGFPSFFSNLQVIWLFSVLAILLANYYLCTHLLLISGSGQRDGWSIEITGCLYPRRSSVSDTMESVAASEADI
jgi:hypothetical protein